MSALRRRLAGPLLRRRAYRRRDRLAVQHVAAVSANIADFVDADEPALIAWTKACTECHQARVARIMAEAKERRRKIAGGEIDG